MKHLPARTPRIQGECMKIMPVALKSGLAVAEALRAQMAVEMAVAAQGPSLRAA